MISNEILRLQHIQPLLDVIGCLQHHGYKAQALSQHHRLLLQQRGYSLVAPTLEGLHSIESRVEFCVESFFGDIYDALAKAIQWCIDLIKELLSSVRKIFVRTDVELFVDNFNKATELLDKRGSKSINPKLDRPIYAQPAAAFLTILNGIITPMMNLYKQQFEAKDVNLTGPALVTVLTDLIRREFAPNDTNQTLFGKDVDLRKCFVLELDDKSGLFTHLTVDIQPAMMSGKVDLEETGWQLIVNRATFLRRYTDSVKTFQDASELLDSIRASLEADKAKIKGADSVEMKSMFDKISGVNAFAMLVRAAQKAAVDIQREVNKINIAILKMSAASSRSTLDPQ